MNVVARGVLLGHNPDVTLRHGPADGRSIGETLPRSGPVAKFLFANMHVDGNLASIGPFEFGYGPSVWLPSPR